MKEDNPLDKENKNGDPRLSFSRREFLEAVGGGIIIFFSCGDLTAQERRPPGYQELPGDFNAFLRIGADGRVACFTGKIEMGQGIVTSLAQMLADELDVPLETVDMVMGDTDLCPWDMGTFGSRTTRFFGPPLREAAAEARATLIQLASEHLQLNEAQLTVKEGVVVDKNNGGNRVTYAELAKGKSIERHLPKKPPLKAVSDFSIVGKPAVRKDAPAKVTGRAQYAGDIRVPGMLHARILRPPMHGAKLKSVDTSALRDDKEIKIVQEKDLVAVLHLYPDVAEQALSKIKAKFELPEAKVTPKTIFKHLLNMAPEGEVVTQGGNLTEGERDARETFEATYLNQYVAHATIETHTALAKIDKDRVTVWASTQRPFGAKEEVAQALGISPQKVRVIAPFVGGGFGGKSQNQQAIEAARLAKLTGRPVQVARSRQEEFFYDTFRPAAIVKIRSGVSETNQIVYWNFDVYFAGPRGAEQFYNIPHHRELSHGHYTGLPGVHPFGTGPWRAPGSNTNTFARESHIDMMAAKKGVDPLEFRLKNLVDQRMIGVLKVAAGKFGWKTSPTPSGRGFGLACATDVGAYVATMAEVEVDQASGKVRVKRMVCAQDMGLAINPEGARIQMEGGLMMGLGYALTEEVRFDGGRILDSNFDTYEIPRFSWLPRIETVLVENSGFPPAGGGEPPIVCTGGVIANAIFDATGARLFELPMTPERIKKALAEAKAPGAQKD
ncbi:MAG TPA: molybdopterin cofactor-binding domain-containing protein [Thermodesulfobacteriota bacterium]|nr:molybdopterin cofactor-binding domain-containing protein [Thermodesulfobacteriota bacterium]